MKLRHVLCGLTITGCLLVGGAVVVEVRLHQVADGLHQPIRGMRGDAREPVPAKSALAGDLSLRDLRLKFRTVPTVTDYEATRWVLPPDYNGYSPVKYPAADGDLWAFLTRDPGDGKKHPAVVWAHGGFGSIGPLDLDPQRVDDDQSPDSFREAGFVVMYPSWRGENDNPGGFELYYGEADDLIAAVNYVRGLPYVDASRVYLMGHSSGGTLVLLAVEMGAPVRAAFSFGGTPDIGPELASTGGQYYRYKQLPFDWQNDGEVALRSPVNFVRDIHVPTEYIEGQEVTDNVRDAHRLAEQAKATGAPLHVHIVRGADHFNVLRPAKRLVAEKLLADTGDAFRVSMTDEELDQAFAALRQAKVARANEPFAFPTPCAARLLRIIMADAAARATGGQPFVRVSLTADGGAAWKADWTHDLDELECEAAGAPVVAARPVRDRLGAVELLGELVDGNTALAAQPVSPPTGRRAAGDPKDALTIGDATVPAPAKGYRWTKAIDLDPAAAQGAVYVSSKEGSDAHAVLAAGMDTPPEEKERANMAFGAFDGIIESMRKQGYTNFEANRLRIQAPFPDRIAFTILARTKDGKPVANRCVFIFRKHVYLFQMMAPTEAAAKELARCAEDLRESSDSAGSQTWR